MEIIESMNLSEAARRAIKTYNEAGDVITDWDFNEGWFEDTTEVIEDNYHIMTQIYHPYTDEQKEELRLKAKIASLEESRRPLTFEEAVNIILRTQVNTVDIPDQTSLRMIGYYPAFADIIGQTVKQGFKFVYDGNLYKTLQGDLLIQEHFAPGTGTESLYVRIDLEHSGVSYDPISYTENMELIEGLYYIQDDVLYLCTRATGMAVYNPLNELVGIYVEIVS